MYADISLQKIIVLFSLGMALSLALVTTAAVKARMYGTTPPFASIELAWKELTLRARYSIEQSLNQLPATAYGALMLMQGKNTFQREPLGKKAYGIPVLTYHRIVTSEEDSNNTTEQNFRDQMFTLKQAGWETITLKEYMDFMRGLSTVPEKSFLITFDDGAKDSFYPVDPIFKALGYEGVNYIIATAPHIKESAYYLSEAEVKRMLETGRWEIGSHSNDGHRPYQTDKDGGTGIFFADKLWLPKEARIETTEEFVQRIRTDLTVARSTLESTYGVPIETFAFPLGNETGIEGAANFLEGADRTEAEARTLYALGFLQTNNQGYTYNYPHSFSFISRRIHVDHDWNGTRLLEELERGAPKDLPFSDNFSENKGWIAAWGDLELGRNNFTLVADENSSSASAFLDGSALWNTYSYDASLNWQEGHVSLLADVADSRTYDSCAFGDGIVRIQHTENGETVVLAEKRNPAIAHQDNARMGIRVRGSVIECTWDYESVLESYDRATRFGGIGIQIWSPNVGEASIQVSEILVRPITETTASSTPSTESS